ncbi:MAG: S41 family peptidase [Thalassobaculaceae bacterium]
MTDLHVLRARLTDLITLLLVATFLTTCSADRSLVKYAGFNAGATQDVLATAFAGIVKYHVESHTPRSLALHALDGLSTLDDAVRVASQDGKLWVTRGDHPEIPIPLPRQGDTDDWAEVVVAAVEQLRPLSPVLAEKSTDDLLNALLPRALSQLDQYSRYADPEMARDRRAARHGFTGIGVTITQDDGRVRINQVYDRSPAAKAGLKAGDIIVAVDGTVIEDGDIRAVARRVRGLSGTLVTLTLRRREATLNIAIRRAPVVPQTIALSREGGFSIIKISGFNEHTSRDLVRALDRGGADGRLDGVILDLRQNRGGLLNEAVEVADLFIPEGTLLATHGRHPRADQSFKAEARDRLVDVPMVALVDRGSASAAEIVAGALQDSGRALVVGTRTFGKGSVQTVLNLPNGGEMTVTWARMFAPSGYALSRFGVYPSVCVGDIAGGNKAIDGQAIAALDTHHLSLRRRVTKMSAGDQDALLTRCAARPADKETATTRDHDLEVARTLLRDPALYAKMRRKTAAAIADASPEERQPGLEAATR